MSQYFKEYGRALEMLRKIDSYTGEKIQNFRKDVLYKGVASHIAYSLEFLNNPVEIEFIPTTMSVKDILEDCGKTL